ncbi:MAG TPA: hypothetical protein DEH22_02065, partial [Chloroflexi bacterium]|nr:hypothetical protein [Chloroflexota bacterium]
MPKQKKRWIVIGIVLVLVIAGLILAANWRTVGKQMANPLRGLLGVQAVAKIETVIFKVQDQIEQWKFDLGLAEAENPFGVAASPIEGSPTPASQVIPPTQTESPTPTENPAEPQSTVDPESLAEP